MPYEEIPSDSDVVSALRELSGRATAIVLCDRLVAKGHPRRESQLAIQRAIERDRIVIESDWTLRVCEEEVAA